MTRLLLSLLAMASLPGCETTKVETCFAVMDYLLFGPGTLTTRVDCRPTPLPQLTTHEER